MINFNICWRVLMIISALCLYCPASFSSSEASRFKIGEGSFFLNGKPFVIKAAELHYPRIPVEYWDQRIKLTKALGMNTVCLYTFWNVHESKEGEFDFTGQNDIRKFIKLCEENGLLVILRPGPYVCAEWEMGGLPWWLLKKKDISLRDNDPYFLSRVELFQKALAAEISDLTVEKGGPVIMIQVENEYGAYGTNRPYVSNIRDILKRNYGEEVVMFQCDWSSNFTLNGLDDLVWTMNFGTGADVESQFEHLKSLRPLSPLMCSEFWSGWFDKWGAAHETRPEDEMIKGIDEMLSRNISFSLYMTHGGTNWGHWAGANSPGYAPDVTSYDYDAPISESGQPVSKYWSLRKLLAKYSPEDSLPSLPELISPIEIGKFTFTEFAPLSLNLPEPEHSEFIKTMEEFDQGFGSIIYETSLPEVKDGTVLKIEEPHDYAQIFINGEFAGKLDRRLGETELMLESYPGGSKLRILVEAMGRINFGVAIKDFKGITDKVSLIMKENNSEMVLNNWTVYKLPDELSFYEGMNFLPLAEIQADSKGRFPRGVYRGKFNVEKPSDTFLNFETWGKGLVYVNGHPLGRIWEIGPQQTLYTPGPWLKEGENEILVFDIVGPSEFISEGLLNPIIDKLQGEAALKRNRKDGETLDFGNLSPVFGGSFPTGNGWKRQEFEHVEIGRYLAIEALSTAKKDDYVAIAELYVIGEKGERLSREKWTVNYADSEDLESGNNNADKVFDLQESTYWKTEASSPAPHVIVIDLGAEEKIRGIEYLPRAEYGAPGAIKDYRVFLSKTPFGK